MKFAKIFYYLAIVVVGLIFSASSRAVPITFEFSGTVTDTILMLNGPWKKFTTHPEWNGQKVNGTLTLDLAKFLEDSVVNPTHNEYSGYGSPSDSAWMMLNITNPDGTVFDTAYSAPINPPPFEVVNLAYVYLTHLSRDYYGVPQSDLYISRQYEGVSPFPKNYMELALRANGDNVSLLTSSANFDDVIIRPEFANMHNSGHVFQIREDGFYHDYYFNIDSFERKPADVAEPSTLLILFFGLIVILGRKINIPASQIQHIG